MALPKQKSRASTPAQIAKVEARIRASDLSPRSIKHPDFRGVLLRRGDLRVIVGSGGKMYRLQACHPQRGWINALQARSPQALADKCNPHIQPLRRHEIAALPVLNINDAAERLDSDFLRIKHNPARHWRKPDYLWTIAKGGSFRPYQPDGIVELLGLAPAQQGLRVIVHPTRESVALQVLVYPCDDWEVAYWAGSLSALRRKIGNADLRKDCVDAFQDEPEVGARFRSWVSTGEAARLFDDLPNDQRDIDLPDLELPPDHVW